MLHTELVGAGREEDVQDSGASLLQRGSIFAQELDEAEMASIRFHLSRAAMRGLREPRPRVVASTKHKTPMREQPNAIGWTR